MDIKRSSTPAQAQTTSSAARTMSPEAAASMQELKSTLAKVNKFLEEGPGGIFKPLNDFMKKNGDRPFGEVRNEVLAKIRE
jgi:hypothetical protein